VKPGDPLVIVGSRDYVEIAVNIGSARGVLHAAIGDTVRIANED
jgi:S-adenosylmethionine hydrolase